MRVDLWIPTANPFTTPELLALIGDEAEQRGIGTIWVGEHVVLFEEYASSYPYAADGRIPAPPGTGLLEPLNTLSFLAAHTTTVRLGTAMVLLPQRNPVYTAKEVATLDCLSNGRLDLGIGVGWLREEAEAVGTSFDDRGARTDEYIEAMRVLWRDPEPTFHGKFTHFDRAKSNPKS
ncbi:MAG TPA: TIGR03619 family F420-dependent LLM class oxidoreductase, partial [Acidimicrobiales bacterium]|nr:TIGR03619 family F420-dependent LLM class oxidoreductase [Acidimicrobiales bacterium]